MTIQELNSKTRQGAFNTFITASAGNYNLNVESEIKEAHGAFLEFVRGTPHYLDLSHFTSLVHWYLIDPAPRLARELPKFSYFKKPVTNVHPYRPVTLPDVYKVITAPRYFKRQTETLRALSEEAQKDYKKYNFDYCCFSGEFSQRSNNHNERLSGYYCVDIDYLNPDVIPGLRKALIDDPILDVQLLFISPRGHGIKAVIPYDTTEFTNIRDFYFLVKDYFRDTYDQPIDECKDVSRATYLCYDAECYINPEIL